MVESKNTGNRFSGASIRLASDEMEIFLAIERDEITVDVRSLFDKRKKYWYSIDTIFSILGHSEYKGVLDKNNAPILRDELSKLID